jgi:nitroreductase
VLKRYGLSSTIQEVERDELAANTVYSAVAETIRQRRTIKQFLPRSVPRAVLQELIELAVWAPNHRLTEPWRFYVLDGAARDRLGEIAAQITVNKLVASGCVMKTRKLTKKTMARSAVRFKT